MKCKNCSYFWKEENEEFLNCHWTIRCPGDVPPCDEEDEPNDHEDYSEYDIDLI